MLVQRVTMPTLGVESWTVLGDDIPIEPIERFLAYLTDIDRSPNTVKAYAHGAGGGLYTGACSEPYRSNQPPRHVMIEYLESHGMEHLAQLIRNALPGYSR